MTDLAAARSQGSVPATATDRGATNMFTDAPAHLASHGLDDGSGPRTRELQVLHLEDSAQDRDLIRRVLVAEGFSCRVAYAGTKTQFETALAEKSFDIILSDFSIPSYDGLAALSAARSAQPKVPFMFVSGTIGEERAVDGLKSGATDCVLKERLGRLGPAVRRALKEAFEAARRTELEDQLRQAQKMEAIGRLVGGVAHDFNNLLTIIGGNAELLFTRDETLQGRSREWLKQVLSATERAGGLARQLLALGRKQALRPEVLNLNHAVTELLKMLGRVIGDDIRLTCQLSSAPAFLYGDLGMIEQVLMNLVVNARDAMPRGGDLVILTERVRLQQRFAPSTPAERRPGDFVRLSVADTGTGIPPQNLQRIFEPFFTTKEVGKGTGLGLATVQGIVKQHHGWIEVDSTMGYGTTFAVYFPSIAPPATGACDGSSPTEVQGGTETILLVEDEPPLRQFTASVLADLGYQVFETHSGRAALDLWPQTRGTVDLLLTDMVMPEGITGSELARRLRDRKPSLKIMFSSGYSGEDLGMEALGSRPNHTFLQKPYSPRTLAKAVRQCLDAR